MVWACGKNGWVPFGQKGVDGRSQWGTGARETEVRLDGWCEGGLRQQRNDGGGCADNAGKIGKSGEHWYICNWMSFTRPFLLGPVFYRTAPPVLWWWSYGEAEGCRYMMRLGLTVKRAQLLKRKAHASGLWAKGCILMTVCVFYLTWHDYPYLV